MTLKEQKISCPKCGESISIDDVLTHQVEEKIKKNFEASYKIKEQELLQKSEKLEKQAAELAKNKIDIDSEVNQKLASKLASERLEISKKARIDAEKEQSEKTALLEDELKNRDEKLKLATQNEIELRKEKIKLAEDKRVFELEKMRQLEEERKSIEAEASKKAAEEQQYKIAQLEKRLSDATKANDDLARKLEQGSQQLQGEIQELALEDILKNEFIYDEIVPVPKGISGADIIQKISDRSGNLCGQIMWESKTTKAWSDGWIQKLKDDQRAAKADLAVIVSTVLPKGMSGFGFRDGIWICDVKLVIAVASALRMNLESINREKRMSVGKNEKMEILYAYLTGVEFQQRVGAIIDAFNIMERGIKKERVAYEKIWSEREKQLKKVITNTVGMYGDLNGLVTLPQIQSLELELSAATDEESDS